MLRGWDLSALPGMNRFLPSLGAYQLRSHFGLFSLHLQQHDGTDHQPSSEDLQKLHRLSQEKEGHKARRNGLQGRRNAGTCGANIVDPHKEQTKGNDGPNHGDIQNPYPLGQGKSSYYIMEGGIEDVPREGRECQGIKEYSPWSVAVHPSLSEQSIPSKAHGSPQTPHDPEAVRLEELEVVSPCHQVAATECQHEGCNHCNCEAFLPETDGKKGYEDGSHVLKEDGCRHLDLADGIKVGNLYPGHAYSTKQEEVAEVFDADSEETFGKHPKGRR